MMQHDAPELEGDARHLLDLPDEVLRLILGPKYSPAATMCRHLRTMSQQATKRLVIQCSELRLHLLADKLDFAHSLPALRDLSIRDMPNDCDDETVSLLADLTNLTRLEILSYRLQDEELILEEPQSHRGDINQEEPWLCPQQRYEYQHTAETLAAALSGLTRLQELLLPGNALRGNAQEAVAGLAGLTLLDLSDNAVDPANPGMLACLTALQHLDLASHPRSPQTYPPVCMDVLATLPLRTLLMHGLNLGAQGRALATMTALRHLEIDGVGLDYGVVQALPTLTALTRLSLEWLPLYALGPHNLQLKLQRLVHPALQLASVLQMTTLQSLTLPAALLAESGAAVLLALPHLHSVKLTAADFDTWGPPGLSSLTAITRLELPNSCMRVHSAATVAGLLHGRSGAGGAHNSA